MLGAPPKEKSTSRQPLIDGRLLLIASAILLVTMASVYAFVSYELAGWDANKVGALIGEDIHRKVHLGKTTWNLGLGGIEFNFDSVQIDELDGTHFVSAGPSKVSLALTPLIHREFFPKELIFSNPEIWVVKLKGGKWNYSDLPNIDATKYVSHVLCQQGKLHVVDKSDGDDKNLDGLNVDNIKFALNRQFGWFRWPFSLACEISGTKYHTKVNVSGVGSGALSDWKKSNHNWNVNVTGFDPHELAIFGMPPTLVAAPINLQLNGAGTLSDELKTSLSFDNPEYLVKAKEVRLKGDFASIIAGLGNDKNVPVLAKQKAAEQPANYDGQLDKVLSGPLKNFNADVEFKDGAVTIKKSKMMAGGSDGRLKIQNGTISVSNLQAAFADGKALVSGNYSSSKKYDAQVTLQSVKFDSIRHFLDQTKIYTLAPRFAPVSGVVKTATLNLRGEANKATWVLDANPQGIYYTFGKQDKLITLSGGNFRLDKDQFKLLNVTGTLGSATTFKLNGTGGTAEHAPMALTAAAKDVDLDTARKLLSVLEVKLPPSPADKMEGSCKQTDITLSGTLQNPQLDLVGAIKQIYVQDKNKTRTFELTAGNFVFKDNIFTLQQIQGEIGKGTFALNGHATMTTPPKLDVTIKAKELDLSNVKVVLKDLKMETPLLAEELLAGRVQALDSRIKGTMDNPTITASLIPGDVEFEPLGTARPIHIKNGHVDYINDSLKVQDVDVSTPRGSLVVSLVMDKLSKSSELSKFEMKSPGLDIGDLNAYLVADRTPPLVRDKYLAILHANEITNPKGKISGHLDYRLNDKSNTPSVNGLLHVADLSAKVSGFAVQDVVGDVKAESNDVNLTGVKGAVGKSTFTLKGTINDFADQRNRVWHLAMFSRISMQEVARLAGDATASEDGPGVQPVKIAARVEGAESQKTVTFTAQLDKTAAITFKTTMGSLAKPPGEEARIDGSMAIQADKITLNDTYLKFGDVLLDVAGSVDNSHVTTTTAPNVQMRVHAANFVPMKTLVAFMPGVIKPEYAKGIAGTVRGGVSAQGALNNLKFKGGAEVKDFGMAKLNLSGVNGKFRADDWVSFSTPGQGVAVGQIPISFEFPTAKLQKLLVSNIKGKAVSATNNTWQYQAGANLAKGSLSLTGVIGPKHATCQAKLKNVAADDVMKDLLNAPNELTGTMTGNADMSCANLMSNPLKSWSGTGTLTLTDGKVSRFSLLEKRITQANLLKSGIIGFNLNNLLASVAPVEKGEFKTIVNKFHLQDGTLTIDEMKFSGDELRLRSKGKIDLADNSMQIQVSGKIPRVSQQGPLGVVAPFLGVRGVAGAIEDLPEIFFMGKKTADSPAAARVFAFTIKGPLDKPQLVSQSIYKSFHWIQGSASATAHPLLDGDAAKAAQAQAKPASTADSTPGDETSATNVPI